MDEHVAQQKMEIIRQTHLLRYWHLLSHTERKHLSEQIDNLDAAILRSQQLLLQNPVHTTSQLEPLTTFAKVGDPRDAALGQRLMSEGKVGCMLIAGGQGTRLRFDGPKGLFPVTPIHKKTLFQLCAEKVCAASKQANHLLPLAVMTSPLNQQATLHFFSHHHYFNLVQEQLSFFCQSMLPFLDAEGNLFLEERSKIAEGPNGNGSALLHFVEQGLWEQWHAKGIQYVNFVLIDNPLAAPFDPELIGFHVRQQADITVKCTERLRADEKVGLLVKKEGRIEVVEYSELPEAEQKARNPDGTLRHRCANISLFCLSMDFILRASRAEMPLHRALKSVKKLAVDGSTQQEAKAWKFETFIFDILPLAEKVSVLSYPREQCFAPLKNADGEDSIETVQKLLLQEAKRVYQQVTGAHSPDGIFELAPEFYYPTPEFIRRCRSKPLPIKGYIDAKEKGTKGT